MTVNEATQQVADAWAQMYGWEIIAVILAVAYLALAVRQNPLCWYAGFASTAIYTVLFWNVQLLIESGLNIYYLVISVFRHIEARTWTPLDQ